VETPPRFSWDLRVSAPGLADRIWDEVLRVQERLSDWLAKAKRNYQSEIARKLSVPPESVASSDRDREKDPAQSLAAPEQQSGTDPIRPGSAEDERAAASRGAAEAKRQAETDEASAKDAEARRLADQARAEAAARDRESAVPSAAEQKKRRAEEEKKAEAKRLAEEALRKQAERKRLAEEAIRSAAQRAADEERARREAEVARREEQKVEEEIEIDRLAADVQRRTEDSKDDEVSTAEEGEPAKVQRPKAAGRGDHRPKEYRKKRPGKSKSARAPVRKPVSKAVRPCGGPRIRYVKGRRMYLVQPTDSLWSIAKRYYGSGSRYPVIYRANRGRIKDPNIIIDCQRIHLPKWRRCSPRRHVAGPQRPS
jgi:Membrane protein involved in colicin uptake